VRIFIRVDLYIHEIFTNDPVNANTCGEIWNKISPIIENRNVVVKNGRGFDFPD
jgi:hypothetical protein